MLIEGAGGRVKLANDVTYKRSFPLIFKRQVLDADNRFSRMNQTMEKLIKMEEKDFSPLSRVLFGLDSPTPVSIGSENIQFFDQTLNESQRDAIRFALVSREVALIHGPPGVRSSKYVPAIQADFL